MEKPTIITTGISLEDFWHQFDTRIEAKIAIMLTASSSSPPTPLYYNIPEACRFVRVSRPKLRELRRKGLIKEIRSTDKKILFAHEDLVNYLEGQKKTVNSL
jgi:hypothetical protein